MSAPAKKFLGNIKGPKGDPGPRGDPGDLTQLGDLGQLASIVETRITDIPDLTLIFENKLI